MAHDKSLPNILFFFTDDQRYNTIHALDNPHIHTPVMDSLVEQGTAFTHAHIMGGSVPAVCMPSRAMLHTGRTLFHLEECGAEIPAEHALLGETLRKAGYRTFGAGKWHNGRAAYARSFSDGDEIFFGGMTDHWNVPAYRFDPTGRYDACMPRCPDPFSSNTVEYRQGDHIHAGRHSTDIIADAGVDFLQRRAERSPFFMYLSFLAPHDPRTMPHDYLELYDPDTIDLPPNYLPAHPFDTGELWVRDEQLERWPRLPEAIRRHLAEYYAMISHVDAQMGRVLAVLRARGELDNTLVIFAGDNGLAIGSHGLMGKQNLYDHSVRVPLVMAGPGIPRGARRDALCYLSDLFPTLCDLTGVPTPATVEGRSLAPVIAAPAASPRDSLFFAYTDVQRAVRDRRYKLIEYRVHGTVRHQLFDLVADPAERHDLADDPSMTATVARLRQLMAGWQQDVDDPCSAGHAPTGGQEGICLPS